MNKTQSRTILTEPAEIFYTLASVSSLYPSHLHFLPSLVTPPSPHPLSLSHHFPVALSPIPILPHRSPSSYSPHPALMLLCTDQIASLFPVICFTLIFMKKGEDEEDEVGGGGGDDSGAYEDNGAEMKEEKMREKGGERKRRWGGGVTEEEARKADRGVSHRHITIS